MAVVLLLFGGISATAENIPTLSPDQINAALDDAYATYKDLQEGANADYIPALAKVDPKLYGIALVPLMARCLPRVTSQPRFPSSPSPRCSPWPA